MAGPTSTTTVPNLMPNYWDSVLGENLYPNLFLYQFGTKRTVPANFGTGIKIPRARKQDITGFISEGSIPNASGMSADFISGTLKQFGGAYKHTDVVVMTALSDVVELSLREISRDIAKKMDLHINHQLTGGGEQIIAGNTNFLSSAKVLEAKDLLRAAVQLDGYNNPRPADGHYPTVLHPYMLYDLQSSLSANGWVEVNKYVSEGVGKLYSGEMGRLFGSRIVTSTNIEKLSPTEMDGGTISGWRGYMLAPDSYYVTEISDMTAKTYVKQLGSSGTADPLNQVATVGAKVFFTAIKAEWQAATEKRYCRIESKAGDLY